jgi:16S rRNA (cytosine967-C5)-methyltransferase
VRLVARWLEHGERVDTLLDALPRGPGRPERTWVQARVLGALRHLGRIEAWTARWLRRPPRPRVRAVLLVAGFELIEGGDEGHGARVGHYAVEQTKALCSPAEARLVNAVIRRLAEALAAETAPAVGAPAEDLATFFSHPAWLVRRWLAAFGAEATHHLLTLHQRPGSITGRWRLPGETPPAWLIPTPVPPFFDVPPGHWTDVMALVERGALYIQDPATHEAVRLLGVRPGETLLDACASPGGKALMLADALGEGELVAVDLPGARLERLRQNLARVPARVRTTLVPADLAECDDRVFLRRGLPSRFEGVLIDVPCSNTGVMRHRVDVRWRLQPGDLGRHYQQQTALLAAAARRVSRTGRLVYSTCSLEAEENEQVVKAFLASDGRGWRLESRIIRRPWLDGGDGAAAFLLRPPATAT